MQNQTPTRTTASADIRNPWERNFSTLTAYEGADVITSLDISSDSLAAVGLRELGRQQREILDLVIGAMRNGADDMTRAEIKESYQRVYGKVIESGTVSARVSGLKDAGRLLQRDKPRQCRVTGKTKTVVYVPEKQASLI